MNKVFLFILIFNLQTICRSQIIDYGFMPPSQSFSVISAYQVQNDSIQLFSVLPGRIVSRIMVIIDSSWKYCDSIKIGISGTSLRPGSLFGIDSTTRGSDTAKSLVYSKDFNYSFPIDSGGINVYFTGITGNTTGRLSVYIWVFEPVFIQKNLDIKSYQAEISDDISVTIDGGGGAIETGSMGYFTVPYNGTITGWTILADVSGSIVIDVKKATFSEFPTTASIAGSDFPTLSGAQKNQDLTISGWGDVNVTAGDILEWYVNSATTVTKVNLTIWITK